MGAEFVNIQAGIPQITPKELKQRLDQGEKLFLLDVRDVDERNVCHIGGEHIPKNQVVDNIERLPRDQDIVVYCLAGGRSQQVAQMLQKQYGFTKVSNLTGGMMQWQSEVDSSMSTYW